MGRQWLVHLQKGHLLWKWSQWLHQLGGQNFVSLMKLHWLQQKKMYISRKAWKDAWSEKMNESSRFLFLPFPREKLRNPYS